MNRLVYFSLFITGFTLGILCTLWILKPQLVQVSTPIVRTIEKKDTISITQFKVKTKTDTIYLNRPLIWKEYSYEDSSFSVKFEADTFRNFSYSLNNKEYIMQNLTEQKRKFGDIFLATDLNSIFCGMSYKFIKIGVKYDVKAKVYSPFIGVRFEF